MKMPQTTPNSLPTDAVLTAAYATLLKKEIEACLLPPLFPVCPGSNARRERLARVEPRHTGDEKAQARLADKWCQRTRQLRAAQSLRSKH